MHDFRRLRVWHEAKALRATIPPLLEVANLCQEIAAAGGGVETAPWPAEREKIDIGSIYVAHDRLTELTGWEPKVSLREGLERTIRFYQEHGEHYWT